MNKTVWIFDTTAMEFASRCPAMVGYSYDSMIEMGWCASKTDAMDKAMSACFRSMNQQLDLIKRCQDAIANFKKKIETIKKMKGSI